MLCSKKTEKGNLSPLDDIDSKDSGAFCQWCSIIKQQRETNGTIQNISDDGIEVYTFFGSSYFSIDLRTGDVRVNADINQPWKQNDIGNGIKINGARIVNPPWPKLTPTNSEDYLYWFSMTSPKLNEDCWEKCKL
ncbi:MAG: hypothetical protein KDD67_01240 [Ignavibacteriae bacterium]|nr:hypothetical protein [Ignavibacteriota bacterium]MCB9217655.1 hypothetical protein [Ignavibacteria bacterium]